MIPLANEVSTKPSSSYSKLTVQMILLSTLEHVKNTGPFSQRLNQEVNLQDGEIILKYYACFKTSSHYPRSELVFLNGF